MHNSVTCPHCGKPISIDEVYAHQIEEKILAAEREAHAQELIAAKEKGRGEAAQKVAAEFQITIKNLTDSLAEEREGRAKDRKQIEDLLKEMRKIRQEKEAAGIEMQKKLAIEEEKIRSEAKAQAEESHSLKEKENDKVIQDLKKALSDAQRKAEQGSQQTQGEVLELEIENILRREFPMDLITEVKKGVRGADAIQTVVNRLGKVCGTILWESKNAKWSQGWIGKLKEDARAAHANLAVLVATDPPGTIKTFGYLDGIWIVARPYLTALATALRFNVISLAHERNIQDGKQGKAEVLYEYITSLDFRSRVEAIVEAFSGMQDEIEREKRWFTTKWSRQEKQLRQVVDHTTGMYGDLQGVIGKSLPTISTLDLPEETN